MLGARAHLEPAARPGIWGCCSPCSPFRAVFPMGRPRAQSQQLRGQHCQPLEGFGHSTFPKQDPLLPSPALAQGQESPLRGESSACLALELLPGAPGIPRTGRARVAVRGTGPELQQGQAGPAAAPALLWAVPLPGLPLPMTSCCPSNILEQQGERPSSAPSWKYLLIPMIEPSSCSAWAALAECSRLPPCQSGQTLGGDNIVLPFSFTLSFLPQVCFGQQRCHGLVCASPHLPPGLEKGLAFLLGTAWHCHFPRGELSEKTHLGSLRPCPAPEQESSLQ